MFQSCFCLPYTDFPGRERFRRPVRVFHDQAAFAVHVQRPGGGAFAAADHRNILPDEEAALPVFSCVAGTVRVAADPAELLQELRGDAAAEVLMPVRRDGAGDFLLAIVSRIRWELLLRATVLRFLDGALQRDAGR